MQDPAFHGGCNLQVENLGLDLLLIPAWEKAHLAQRHHNQYKREP